MEHDPEPTSDTKNDFPVRDHAHLLFNLVRDLREEQKINRAVFAHSSL